MTDCNHTHTYTYTHTHTHTHTQSQALRLNRICSNTKFFDKKCIDLEKYLLERGYSEKMISKEILGARAVARDALSEKVNNQEKQNKITLNGIYYPVYRDVRKALE